MIKTGIHNHISVGCLGIELGTSKFSGIGSKIHIVQYVKFVGRIFDGFYKE